MIPHSFSVTQAAVVLGLHPKRVERLVATGLLPAVRDGAFVRVTLRTLDQYARRHGPPSALRRLHAPPDRPLTVAEVARVVGVSRDTVWDYIRRGKLPAYRTPGSPATHYLVERGDLVGFLRTRGTPEALAHAVRLMRPPNARLVVATRDPVVRRATAPWEPVVATSLFGLGWEAGRRPVWGAVIDFTLDTRENAYDAAARLSAEAENPALLGLAAEDAGGRRPPGTWDVILTRPVTASSIATCVRELHAAAGPRP